MNNSMKNMTYWRWSSEQWSFNKLTTNLHPLTSTRELTPVDVHLRPPPVTKAGCAVSGVAPLYDGQSMSSVPAFREHYTSPPPMPPKRLPKKIPENVNKLAQLVFLGYFFVGNVYFWYQILNPRIFLHMLVWSNHKNIQNYSGRRTPHVYRFSLEQSVLHIQVGCLASWLAGWSASWLIDWLGHRKATPATIIVAPRQCPQKGFSKNAPKMSPNMSSKMPPIN